MRLELHHLRVLATIAEHGSLTKAAAALGVSQPALSTQLRRIEGQLGLPVFYRGHRGVTVTPFGEFVLARVRGAISNVDLRDPTNPRSCCSGTTNLDFPYARSS